MQNEHLLHLADSLEANVSARPVLTAQDEVQQEYWSGMINGFRRGESIGYIKAPTGIGKTRIAEAGIQSMLDIAHILHADQAFIITPRQSLVDQIAEEFAEGLPGIDIGKYYQFAHDPDAPVVVTTYDSIFPGIERGAIKPHRIGFVVPDEGHFLLTPKKLPLLSQFPNAAIVPMSATVGYAKDKHLGLHIPEFGSKSIRETVKRGASSPVAVALVRTHNDLSAVRVQGVGADRDYNEADLQKAVNLPAVSKVAAQIHRDFHQGERGLAFCAGIQHAVDSAAEFRAAGISAEAVWGTMDQDLGQKDAKKRTLERHAKGEIDVLTSDKLISFGHNDRGITVIHNLKPTLSELEAEQRGGRGMRIDPNNPDKMLRVYDYVFDDTKRSKKPVSFAKVIEAAVLTREVGNHKDVPFYGMESRPTPVVVGDMEVVYEPADVMWAVNNDYQFLELVVPDEYKTLMRVSAETGIPEDALEYVVRNGKTIGDDWMGRDYEGPKFGTAKHYPLIKTWDMVNLVMEAQGMGMDDTSGELIYTPLENPTVTPFLKKLKQLSKKVDTEILARVSGQIYTTVNSDPKYFEDFFQ